MQSLRFDDITQELAFVVLSHMRAIGLALNETVNASIKGTGMDTVGNPVFLRQAKKVMQLGRKTFLIDVDGQTEAVRFRDTLTLFIDIA